MGEVEKLNVGDAHPEVRKIKDPECGEVWSLKLNHKGLRYPYKRFKEKEDEIYWKWCDLVSKYSKTKLPYNLHKIPAFAGLTEDYEHFLGENVTGLWRRNMEYQLLWTGGYGAIISEENSAPS
ncbi:hypothetical protein B0J14DRAFT_472868 [Halenospora varia]|nr:hypothetical protein B0J14DRAFT_472868 [Halenospora varia]